MTDDTPSGTFVQIKPATPFFIKTEQQVVDFIRVAQERGFAQIEADLRQVLGDGGLNAGQRTLLKFLLPTRPMQGTFFDTDLRLGRIAWFLTPKGEWAKLAGSKARALFRSTVTLINAAAIQGTLQTPIIQHAIAFVETYTYMTHQFGFDLARQLFDQYGRQGFAEGRVDPNIVASLQDPLLVRNTALAKYTCHGDAIFDTPEPMRSLKQTERAIQLAAENIQRGIQTSGNPEVDARLRGDPAAVKRFLEHPEHSLRMREHALKPNPVHGGPRQQIQRPIMATATECAEYQKEGLSRIIRVNKDGRCVAVSGLDKVGQTEHSKRPLPRETLDLLLMKQDANIRSYQNLHRHEAEYIKLRDTAELHDIVFPDAIQQRINPAAMEVFRRTESLWAAVIGHILDAGHGWRGRVMKDGNQFPSLLRTHANATLLVNINDVVPEEAFTSAVLHPSWRVVFVADGSAPMSGRVEHDMIIRSGVIESIGGVGPLDGLRRELLSPKWMRRRPRGYELIDIVQRGELARGLGGAREPRNRAPWGEGIARATREADVYHRPLNPREREGMLRGNIPRPEGGMDIELPDDDGDGLR